MSKSGGKNNERFMDEGKIEVFKMERVEDDWVVKVATKAYKELIAFFKFNWCWNIPRVVLLKDRATIDAMRGRKSEPWVVGFGSDRSIYVLDYKNITKESSHHDYDKDHYKCLIKHEMTHLFLTRLMQSYRPRWLVEGICLYVADQLKYRKQPIKFSNFLEFDQN